MKTIPQTFVLLLCVTFATSSGFAQDSILLNRSGRGSTILGRITETSKTDITVDVSGDPQKVAANEIKRLNLASEPGGLRSARNSVLAGQFEQAMDSLENIRGERSTSGIIKAEIAFYRAFCRAQVALRGSGDAKDAARELVEFLRENRESFHYYEAVEALGQLALATGEYEAAVRYYDELAKAPWPEYQLKARSLQAQALRADRKPQEALQRFDEVLSSSINDAQAARQKAIASAGKAACLAELGKTDEAIQLAEQIMASNDPTDADLFAPCYIALGTAYRKSGKTLDAALAYLHVDIIYFAERDAHAEALFYLSDLWTELKHPNRALEAKTMLRSRYGGTVWAKM